MEERLLKHFISIDKAGALKMKFWGWRDGSVIKSTLAALPEVQFSVPTWQLTTGTLFPDLTPSNQST